MAPVIYRFGVWASILRRLLPRDLVMLSPSSTLTRCAVGVGIVTCTNQAPVRGLELNAVADDIGAKPYIHSIPRERDVVRDSTKCSYMLCPRNNLLCAVLNFCT